MTSNNTSKPSKLFVAPQVVKAYNTTAAWVFADIGHHIGNSGYFSKKLSFIGNVAKRVGCSKTTVTKYLDLFVQDGVLIQDGYKYTFNEHNTHFADTFLKYYETFGSLSTENSRERLVQVSPEQLRKDYTPEQLQGKKAEHERSVMTLEGYIRDQSAQNRRYKKTKDVTFNRLKYLEELFGVCWLTIKRLITKLSEVRKSFSYTIGRTLHSLVFKRGSEEAYLQDQKDHNAMKDTARGKSDAKGHDLVKQHMPALRAKARAT